MVSELMQMKAIDVHQMKVNLSFSEIANMMDDITGYSAAYFYDPDLCIHFLALGEVASCQMKGDERFKVAKQFLSQLSTRKVSGQKPPLRVFGGFSFVSTVCEKTSVWSGWPEGKLFLPRVLMECPKHANHTAITVYQNHGEHFLKFPKEHLSPSDLQRWTMQVCRDGEQGNRTASSTSDYKSPSSRSESEKKNWIQLVKSGSEAVLTERLKKVVLAREVVEPVGRTVSEIIHHLNNQYPSNFTFAIWHSDACFLGSSPERLASISDGVLKVDCLAGSEARGYSMEEDKELGKKLLLSRKNLAEHQAVVDRVTEDVTHLVDDFHVAKSPILKKLTNVQHLYTPVQGKVKKEVGIFDVIETLHPTPAVAGVPSREALQFIEEMEPIDRGWYAGPIGYADVSGNGTFAVALRSGLVRGANATLFAGGGIMADSVPETEWEETELKLMPMRSAIRNNKMGIRQ